MFPEVRFLQLDLYTWLSVAGIIAALVIFRVYSDKKQVPAKLQNVCLVLILASIAIGYGFAILFQAVYDFTKSGKFVIDTQTGMTFYGGLIGGSAVFLILYFTVAKKVCGGEIFRHLNSVSGVAACAISLGHSLGRIGCLMAGCCYGRETDSWIGIYLPAVGAKVIPTQLIESIFLLLLFFALTALLFRTRINGFSVYLIAYGIFRFVIEFFRADDRGGSVIPWLSPSQVWSVILFAVGTAVLVTLLVRDARRKDGAPTDARQ